MTTNFEQSRVRARRSRSLVAAGAVLFSGAPAMAATWPSNIVGGWNASDDAASATLVVTSQTASPSSPCATIVGQLTDETTNVSYPISGFYCPSTGRFSFLRNNNGTQATSRAYVGNVGPVSPGPTQMSGGYAEFVAAGRLGNYPFYALRINP